MEHQIGVRLIVKGRISTVRWLKQPPYHARKVRGEKGYWHYLVELTDLDAAEKLELKLTGQELAATFRDDSLIEETGVCVKSYPIFDEDAVAADLAAAQAA